MYIRTKTVNRGIRRSSSQVLRSLVSLTPALDVRNNSPTSLPRIFSERDGCLDIFVSVRDMRFGLLPFSLILVQTVISV